MFNVIYWVIYLITISDNISYLDIQK